MTQKADAPSLAFGRVWIGDGPFADPEKAFRALQEVAAERQAARDRGELQAPVLESLLGLTTNDPEWESQQKAV